MAYSEQQLRNIKIATLKQIATALKKKLNLGVGITRFAKDNLISFILEHQTEDFVYNDFDDEDADDTVSELIIEELPEPVIKPKAVGKTAAKPESGTKTSRAERSSKPAPGEAEQLPLADGSDTESEQDASAEVVRSSRPRIKRLSDRNSRQAKAAVPKAEEENVRAKAAVSAANAEPAPTAERSSVSPGKEQRMRRSRNKRQCANVPLVDKDNEPVAAEDTSEWRERGERRTEAFTAKPNKSVDLYSFA